MAKKTIDDLRNIRDSKILVRVDFNVPQDAAGNITNDRRIRAAIPTLTRLLEADARLIVMSHLGRPKGDPRADARFNLYRVASRLQELLRQEGDYGVHYIHQVVGPEAEKAARNLSRGGVLLLENLRFHPGEQAGDPAFAAQLARLGDAYVNDAFGTCHRSDASMVAVPAAMKTQGKPRVVGLLVAKELQILDQLLANPARPFLAILGGAKVSDKIGFIKSLLGRVERMLIGGAMTYTFMQAQGRGIGNSKAEADKVDLAKELLRLGQGKIALPVDHLVVDRIEPPRTARVVEGDIPAGAIGVDIGPKTIAQYTQEIATAGTAIWNGPLGKFEDEPFNKGTHAVAEAMAQSKTVTIVGGGETAEAVEDLGLDAKMKHVSTGGGAFLEYIEGTPFPALAQIEDV